MTIDREILQKAVDAYGTDAQILMAIEEMAELSAKLAQWLRGRYVIDDPRIIEEVADVKIMIAQLEIICGDTVQSFVDQKMERLKQRLERDDMRKNQ